MEKCFINPRVTIKVSPEVVFDRHIGDDTAADAAFSCWGDMNKLLLLLQLREREVGRGGEGGNPLPS